MNPVHFEPSPNHEHPAIVLDMPNFMEHLSDENVCEKAEARDDGIQTNAGIINCKTEDNFDLEEISSVSGVRLKQEGKVKEISVEFIVFFMEVSYTHYLMCLCK